jgi:hypothetical protein
VSHEAQQAAAPRRIAEGELARLFGGLDAAVRDQLATSLVRQWLTNDGHAGLVTPTQQLWFQLVAEGDLLEVKVSTAEGGWGRALSQHWGVPAAEVPELLHRLNLCQAAWCRTADGRVVELRVEPRERAVRCRELPQSKGDARGGPCPGPAAE